MLWVLWVGGVFAAFAIKYVQAKARWRRVQKSLGQYMKENNYPDDNK